MTEHGFSGDLADSLKRWVDARLIDPAQAERIGAFEAARGGAPRAPRHSPMVVEVLGYLGAALAVAAGTAAVEEAWPNMPTGVAIGIAAFGATALLLAGALLQAGQGTLRRVRLALWGGSIACTATVGALTGAQVLHFAPAGVALLAAGGAGCEAIALWAVSAGALMQVAAFSTLAVLSGAAVGQIDPDLDTWGPGLAIWLLAAAWGLAAHRGWLPHPIRPADRRAISARRGRRPGRRLRGRHRARRPGGVALAHEAASRRAPLMRLATSAAQRPIAL